MAEMSVIAGLFHPQERTLALVLVVVVIFPAPARAEAEYIFDDAHGLVRLTVKLAGLTQVEGRSTETDAAIATTRPTLRNRR